MKIIRKISLASMAFVPMMAMAHPGHHAHKAGFWSGFSHPWTGLDHLLMVLSFGILMWSVSKKWKIAGVLGLVVALIIGFVFGAQQWVTLGVAEYGIVASLWVVALALWKKSNVVLAVTASLMASFHGVAHGVELASQGHLFNQMLGMISAMTVIYSCGLAVGALIVKYVPQAKKVIATVVASVAVFGLI